MARTFAKDFVRTVWTTREEPVGYGDGHSTRFRLPDGVTEKSRLVIYTDGLTLPSDWRTPVLEGVGDPILDKTTGQPLLDKEKRPLLSTGRPVLEDKDGMKIPVFRPRGWKTEVTAEGTFVVFWEAPAIVPITCARLVDDPKTVEPGVECFRFKKVDRDALIELAVNRPEIEEGDSYRTAEEIQERATAREKEYLKLPIPERKKKRAADEVIAKQRMAGLLEWAQRAFLEMVDDWANVRVVEDGETVDLPFSAEEANAYLAGDGTLEAMRKASVFVSWLLERVNDVARAQREFVGILRKN